MNHDVQTIVSKRIILSDYYLVKVFENRNYMESFNNGTVYSNSLSYFWKLENAFQQDCEGVVFQQGGKSFFLNEKPDIDRIMKETSSVDEALNKIEKMYKNSIILETKDAIFSINGYILCFYLLPKKVVSLTNDKITIIDEMEKKKLIIFLEGYIKESQTHDFYASFFDAEGFCTAFINDMSAKGYNIEYDMVRYQNLSESNKLELYQQNDIKSIVFTKPIKYSYQKEFRIFINKSNENVSDHICESGILIASSLIGTFCYNQMKAVIG